MRNGQRAAAVRQDDVGHALQLRGRGHRQRRADDVENAAGVADPGIDRHAGEHALVGADHDDVAAGRRAPGWNEAGQQQLQALERHIAILPDRSDAVEALGQHVGEGGEVALHRGAFLPVLVDHLHEGAEADRDQERNDKGGHRAAKRNSRW